MIIGLFQKKSKLGGWGWGLGDEEYFLKKNHKANRNFHIFFQYP